MDGHLEGLEDIFNEYKRKRKEAEEEAKRQQQAAMKRFANLKKTERRRRLLKKKTQENIENVTNVLIVKLTDMLGSKAKVQPRDEKRYAFYKRLKDTFNAFDRDGNGELGYPEYSEAWKCN